MTALLVNTAVQVVGIVSSIYSLFQISKPDPNIEKLNKNQYQNVRIHLKAGLLPNHKNLLDKFLDEYLGTIEKPVPFGGREKEFNSLSKWFNSPSSEPYLLLTAPAGKGKTALLVKWSSFLITQRLPPRVLFIPISVRFNTSNPEVHLEILARGLSQTFGEPIWKAPSEIGAEFAPTYSLN